MAVLRNCSKWMSGQEVPNTEAGSNSSNMEDQKEDTSGARHAEREGASPSFAPRNRALSRSSEEGDSCCSSNGAAADSDTTSVDDNETQGSPMKISKTVEEASREAGHDALNAGNVIVVSTTTTTDSKVSLERQISSLNAEFLKKTLEDVKAQVDDGKSFAVPESDTHQEPQLESPLKKPSGATTIVVSVPEKKAMHPTTEKTSPAGKKSQKRKSPPSRAEGQSAGRWTHVEHEAFLDGLKVFGREWKKVAKLIPTRSSAQVRSHAQKYFAKLDRDESVLMLEQKVLENNNLVHAQIPPSVQRNVERILANPTFVEQEVQDTMNALQERYRELQRQLEEQHPDNQEAAAAVVLTESDDNESSHAEKKRRREGESGSCCSSSAGATSTTLGSLGNEELIALSVLGGALANAQPPAASAAEDDQVGSTNTSLASSEASWASKEEED